MCNPFAAYHPVVGLVYIVAAIVFAMAAFHPVYVGLSLAGAFAASWAARGLARTARLLPGIALLWAAIAVFNLLFSPAGATPLVTLFGRTLSVEALAYGATMGGLFAAMTLWFTVYDAVMDSEATATVAGNVAPMVALMVSQVMRLVPQFLRRGREIEAVQACTSAAAPRAKREAFAGRVRTMSVLMGWGMEDGIVRGDAMRSRGWGCGARRTRYRRQRFAARDAVALAVVAVLVAGNAFLASVACGQFWFYPYMDTLVAWWGYVPYVVFLAVPTVLAVRERVLWR